MRRRWPVYPGEPDEATTYHRFRAEDVSPGLSRECRYHGDVLSRLFWECRLDH